MTTGVKLTSGLVGLYMAICLDALIYFGKQHYHSTRDRVLDRAERVRADARRGRLREPQPLALDAHRARRSTTRKMNWTAIAELALAVMITQMDLFNRLLKTTPLTAPQFGLALAAAVLLLALWEIGKLIARRREARPSRPQPNSSTSHSARPGVPAEA